MKTLITGGKIFKNGSFENNDALVVYSSETPDADGCRADSESNDERVISFDNSFFLPSFCDVHVHFREPGQSYKETILTGSLAAAHGGYTSVCTMPNLDPAPCDSRSLRVQTDIIERDAVINVLPYGTITRDQSGRGKLSAMEEIASKVVAFTDDGRGVQDRGLMREAMETAKRLGKIIVAHCEDEDLVREGRIRESEWRQIERDLMLADDVGAAYHVCHISAAESVDVIREAKKSGVDVTCETAPHYLMLDEDMVAAAVSADPQNGGRYRMNPPIKASSDRKALIEGLVDGTIDMIATDHAPHSAEEKARGFSSSLNGITGLECAFPVLYSGLVCTGITDLGRLTELMSETPRRRFGISDEGSFTVMDLENEYRIDSRSFASKGRSTPFDGMKVRGRTLLTVCGGRIVYEDTEVTDGRSC